MKSDAIIILQECNEIEDNLLQDIYEDTKLPYFRHLKTLNDHKDNICGCLMLNSKTVGIVFGRGVHLKCIWVDCFIRRQGVGRLLVMWYEDEIRRRLKDIVTSKFKAKVHVDTLQNHYYDSRKFWIQCGYLMIDDKSCSKDIDSL